MTSKTNFHKFLTILTTLALTYSLNVIYSQDLSSYVRLSGEITNPNSDKITIRGNGYIKVIDVNTCLLYTSPSPRDATLSRMPSSA